MQSGKKKGLIRYVALGIFVMVIAIYFLKSCSDNPLEGNWKYQGNGYTLKIRNNDTATLSWDYSEDVVFPYEIGREEKEITFSRDADIMKLLEQDILSEEQTEFIETMIDSFTYSVDGTQLILTERDFGEQIVLIKVK